MKDISDTQPTECDRQQIEYTGNIQGGAGHAMFISYPEGKIVAADENVRSIPWVLKEGEHIDDGNQNAGEKEENSNSSAAGPTDGGAAARLMLGTNLSSWVPPSLHALIFSGVEEMVQDKSLRSFRYFEDGNSSGSYAISLSPTEDDFAIVGIEIEQIDGSESSPAEFYKTLLSVSRIMECYADEDVVTASCDTVFKLLGSYDRAMVYRFNDDFSGEIIHEVKNENCGNTSYQGMRFPAGDIPTTSRLMYIKNGLRYIHNAGATNVRIVVDESFGACSSKGEMDLSHIRMRSVVNAHIMYLQNMGVKCSMSIAIVVEGKLWGLLAFHGYKKAFKPSLHQRIACETITSMLSVKMEALMKKTQSNRIIKLSEVMMLWEQNNALTSNFQRLGNDFMDIVEADVIVARIQDPSKEEPDTVVIGDASLAPGAKFWTEFEKQPKREVCTSTTRAGIASLGLTEDDCPSSGVAYYGDGLIQIMLGRGLRSKDVAWGGNPDEPKVRKDGMLCPRNSFAKFMEKAKKESRAWSKIDLHVISALMDRSSEYSHNRMISLLKNDIEDANSKYFTAIEKVRDNCEFFAQMSHEIRTPFHGVMGCLNILTDAKNMSPEEIQDMVDTALGSGNHMINLLNDILDISKNQYTSRTISSDKISYQALASDAAHSLKSLAVNNGITFETDIRVPPEGNTFILTDKTKVVQVVSNIINNAIKFSANKTIDVRIELTSTMKEAVEEVEKVANQHAATVFAMHEKEVYDSMEEVKMNIGKVKKLLPNQKWMLISVADSGCGMKPDGLAEMLKPYTQASNGSNRKFQGTGLGLFICLSLCQQLHGFIACSSTKGVGSSFHVGIPVSIPKNADADDAEEMDDISSIASHPSTITELSRIKINGPIAVVDDNKVNVKILVRSLTNECKKAGILEIELITADGGMEAFELYKERRPSVLCIDYHMPGVDGLQATKMIRHYEDEHQLTPCYILSYTADATETTARTLLSHGTDGIMTKPPPKDFLSTLVSRFQPDTASTTNCSAA